MPEDEWNLSALDKVKKPKEEGDWNLSALDESKKKVLSTLKSTVPPNTQSQLELGGSTSELEGSTSGISPVSSSQSALSSPTGLGSFSSLAKTTIKDTPIVGNKENYLRRKKMEDTLRKNAMSNPDLLNTKGIEDVLHKKILGETNDNYLAESLKQTLKSLKRESDILKTDSQENLDVIITPQTQGILQNIGKANVQMNKDLLIQQGKTEEEADVISNVIFPDQENQKSLNSGLNMDKVKKDYLTYLYNNDKESFEDIRKTANVGGFDDKKSMSLMRNSLEHQADIVDTKIKNILASGVENLTEENITNIEQLESQMAKLSDRHKGLLLDYPEIHKELVDNKLNQKAVDEDYELAKANALLPGFDGDVAKAKVLYHQVVSPIGASAVKFAGNISQFALHEIANFTPDENVEGIANRVSDWANDYLDTEKSGSIFKKPTALKGSLFEKKTLVSKGGFKLEKLVPKISETLFQMYALLGGGSIASGAMESVGMGAKISEKLGLITSSFVTTQNDYYQEAKELGMSNNEANNFGNAAGLLTSTLELINPQGYIFGKEAKKEFTKSVFKSIAKGVDMKDAIKHNSKFIAKELIGENIQETSQMLGDVGVKYLFNKKNEDDAFDLTITQDEIKEMVLLTSIISGVGSSHGVKGRNKLETESLYYAAKDFDKFKNTILSNPIKEQMDEKDIQTAIEKVTEYKKVVDGLPKNLSEEDEINLAEKIYAKKKIVESKKDIHIDDVVSAKTGDETQVQIDELNSQISVILDNQTETSVDKPTVTFEPTTEGSKVEYKINNGFFSEEEIITNLGDEKFVESVKNGDVNLTINNPTENVSKALEGSGLLTKPKVEEVKVEETDVESANVETKKPIIDETGTETTTESNEAIAEQGQETISNEDDKQSVGKEKTPKKLKRGLTGRIPLDKRKHKDKEVLNSLAIEPTDLTDHVLQWFISGRGKVSRKAIQELVKGNSETNARIQLIRQEAKGGKSIDEITHDIWMNIGGYENDIDTRDIKNIVEDILVTNSTPKQMALLLNKRHGQGVVESDGKKTDTSGNELFETPHGLMTQDEIDDFVAYQEYSAGKEDSEEVSAYYENMTNEELDGIDDVTDEFIESKIAEIDESKKVEKNAENTIQEKFKTVADSIRKLKTKEIKLLDKDGNEITITKNGLDWNDLVESVAASVEKTGDIASAISDYLSNNAWFNAQSDENKVSIEKQIKDNFGVVDEKKEEPKVKETAEKPKSEPKERIRTTAERVSKSTEPFSKELRESIEKASTTKTVSHDESLSLASKIISQTSPSEALSLIRDKNNKITSDVRMAMMANLIQNESNKLNDKSLSKEEIDDIENTISDLSVEFGEITEDAGRGISILGAINKKFGAFDGAIERAKIKNKNKKFFKEGGKEGNVSIEKHLEDTRKKAMKNKESSSKDAIEDDDVQNLLNDKPKRNQTNKRKDTSSEKIEKIRKKRKELLNELDLIKNNPLFKRDVNDGDVKNNSLIDLDARKITLYTQIALTYMEEGAVNIFSAISKLSENVAKIFGSGLTKGETSKILESLNTTFNKELNEKIKEANQEKAGRLSNLVFNRYKKSISDNVKDPVADMVRILFQKSKDLIKIDDKKGEKISARDKIKFAIENKERMSDVWELAKEKVILRIKESNLTDSQKKYAIKDFESFFDENIGIPFGEKMTEKAFNEKLKEDKTKIEDILVNHKDKRASKVNELIESLVNEAGVSENYAKELAAAYLKAYNRISNKKNLEMLNQRFPSKVREVRRKELFEKIIEAVNLGVLDSDSFRRLFYEKYGLIDENNKDIKEALENFSKQLSKAGNNTVLINNIKSDMADFLAKQQKAERRKALRRIPLNIFYSNILYGYETHIRNQTWNMPSAFIGHIGLVMAKNPANAKFFWSVFKDNFTKGLHSAQSAITTGVISSDNGDKKSFFEDAVKNSKLESVKNFFKFYTIPGRFLKAGDVIISVPLEQVKKSEQLFNMIKKQSNGELSNKEIREAVNDILSHTEERFVESSEKAFNEISEFYDLTDKGINNIDDLRKKIKELKAQKKSTSIFKRGDVNKEIDLHKKIILDYNLSITDNMDRDIYDNIQKSDILSEDIKDYLDVNTIENTKEYARNWAQTASLLAHPKGTLGVAAHFIHEFGSAFPGSKFMLLTFVNAPLNITNSMIDRSLMGFLRYARTAQRGRRGSIVSTSFLEKHRLEINNNPDEQRELLQRAITYTSIQIVLLALSQLKFEDDEGEERKVLDITGPRSDDFNEQIQKEQGDNRKPYHLYLYGREIMNYKSSYLMPLFLPLGAINDYNELGIGKGKELNMVKMNTAVFVAYISGVLDQSSLSSVNELIDAVSGSFKKIKSSTEKEEDEKSSLTADASFFGAKKAAKLGRSLVFPNFILQGNKDVKGLLGMDQKNAVEWHDYFIDDIPVLEDMFLSNRTDHYGRNIPEEFSIPLIPFEKKGNEFVFNFITDIKKNDKYYGADLRHNYTNQNVFDQTIKEYEYDEDGIAIELKGERKLNKTEIELLNTEMGKQLKILMDEETVDDNGKKTTVMDELDKITNNDEYKEIKNKYKSTAKKITIQKLFYKN